MPKKTIMQKKIFFHNSTVSFCVNYIILTPQNIYFFNSQNIYFICQKKSIMLTCSQFDSIVLC